MEKTELELAQDKIKELDSTIKALQGMLGQMVPVVTAVLPLLKERPELDKEMLAQVERMTQVAQMMINFGGNVG